MIFSWLAAVVAVGGLGSLLLVPPRDFGRRFHRLMGFMASLLLASGLAGGALRGAAGWSAVVASVAWVLMTQWAPVSWIRPSLALLTAAGVTAVLGGTAYEPRLPVVTAASWAPAANALAAGLLLGSVAMGMLVGHWYLNVPGLDIRHFRRMTRFLALCLALRILVGLASIATATPIAAAGEVSAWRAAGIREAFFFWQRVEIGLAAPAVLAFMADRTVRIHSTQSATGLLYVTVVFVLIGEMISRFIYVAVGIPQ
jgi:hypothetical protein